jgi:hypothetical protein
MNNSKLTYIVFIWLALSVVASFLKITHRLNEISQILFLLIFVLSVYILIMLLKKRSSL